MPAMWTQTYLFRDLTAPPEQLTITAWGRRFRVVPSETVRLSAAGCSTEVIVDVVGPSHAQTLASPQPEEVVFVEVDDDPSEEITQVPDASYDVIEFVYESGGDITAVGPTPSSSPARASSAVGGRRGR